MIYTLKNQELTVQLTDAGAEIVSVRRGDACEYIWQGDPAYWSGRTPLMFPICGRLYEGKYTHNCKTYEMGNHGFARRSVFAGEQLSEDRVRFTLRDSEETRAMYPFAFELTVEYCLTENRLHSQITVRNTGDCLLPAALGLHPGFNVPFTSETETCFDDWYIEFAEACSPDEILMSAGGHLTGKRQAYELEKGRILRLSHRLFDEDSIFWSNVHRQVTLRSDKSDRFVTFQFPDMPYMGVWHAPRCDAPYVCIEPWCGMPAYDGQVDELTKKSDMFRIQPKAEKSVSYTLIFG